MGRTALLFWSRGTQAALQKKECPLANGVSVGAAATDASLTPTMNERREFTNFHYWRAGCHFVSQ